jgi:hypothetical protein
MRHTLLLVGALALFQVGLAQKTYPYTSVPGDPLETRIYTLDNGLQVWLSRNTDAPRVQTNIAVRAGSKNDPADATGLAHYLEHMLFKGTSKIATSDWAKESVVLKAISDQYELRRTTTDEAKRDAIYHVIDSLSTVAAALAVPNEYDKMIKSIGARGTNAYTSTERTVSINDVPSECSSACSGSSIQSWKPCTKNSIAARTTMGGRQPRNWTSCSTPITPTARRPPSGPAST